MKLRPLGKITTDLEKLLDEMYIQHELQLHEVLAIVKQTTQTHFPESIELYEDDSAPVLYYGHKDGLK